MGPAGQAHSGRIIFGCRHLRHGRDGAWAIGTDTGGSCRIPAAFTGIVGYKPTAARVPKDGCVPLSTTLDSIGPLARTVDCCAILDTVLSGQTHSMRDRNIRALRFLVPETLVFDGIDATVATDFERAVKRLADAGATIVRAPMQELKDVAAINSRGGFSAAESWTWHWPHIDRGAELYDPRVLVRISRGAELTAADYIELGQARARVIEAVEARLADFDALMLPTVPIVAPRLAELERDEDYSRINILVLRNPSLINLIDGCAMSLPMHEPGSAPTGLMLAGTRGSDSRIFEVARAVEGVLSAGR